MGREPAAGRRLKSGCFPREAAVEDMLCTSNISRRGASEKLAELLTAQRYTTIKRAMFRIFVDTCNEQGRVISFKQLIVQQSTV